MNKLKRLERRNMILAGLAVVLGAALFLRAPATATVREENYPLVFPDFVKAEARRIEIIQPAGEGRPEQSIELQMRGEGAWVLENRSMYPVAPGRQERLLDGVAAMRSKGLVTTRQETFDKYEGPTGWVELRVLGANDRVLASFGIGRYTTSYPDIFVRQGTGETAQVLKAFKFTSDMARPETSAWIEPRLLPGLQSESAIRVTLKQPAQGHTVVLVKRGSEPADVEVDAPPKDPEGKKKWWMVEPAEGDADDAAVEDLTRSFTGLRIKEIVSGTKADSDKYGFEKPHAVVTLYLLQGGKVSQHTVTVGGTTEDGSSRYVTRQGSAWVFTVPNYALTVFSKVPDAFLMKSPEPEDDPGAGVRPPPDDGGDDGAGGASGDPDGGAEDPPKEGDGKDAGKEAPPPAPEDPGDGDG